MNTALRDAFLLGPDAELAARLREAGLNVSEGQVTCEPVAQAHGLAYVKAETAIGL